MNILLLSEHYSPKISGTVSYVKHLLNGLPDDSVNIYFVRPSKGIVGEYHLEYDSTSEIYFLNLGVIESKEPEYSPLERNELCKFIERDLSTLVEKYKIEVVHLLYGFFLAEILDTSFLRSRGIKSLFTVHNIPPEECSISWKGDLFWRKWKDDIRKLGVQAINHKRLKKQRFDIYIVPSIYVKSRLNKILPNAEISVIPHGGAELVANNELKKFLPEETINILTVGGIVPHKRQNWIPQIADFLRKNNIKFEWTIAGPNRNNNYYNFVNNEIKKLNLNEQVKLVGALSNEKLIEQYRKSNLYVQLSSEEGFCMTVLDAIAYKLPVIASPVGAIPEMLEEVDGVILDPNLDNAKNVILHYIKILDTWGPTEDMLSDFCDKYRWSTTNNLHKYLYGK